ncbi:MAG: tetratricopeptide repeat protein [Sandaracinaceae bacterium]|nr:tetratricopeptide repeat protein [Sandaracinaceae bacterium]
MSDALARHDRARVLAEVEAARALNPDDGGTIGWAAALYEALGMVEQALAARREAIDLAPEDADALVAYGRTLLRHDQTEAAADAFRRALALRPQDEGVRALLEEIRPAAPRRDEAFATAIEEVLSRRRQSADWPATVLHDLTVNTVFENGLSSSFHQIVTQVHDDEGARQWRSLLDRLRSRDAVGGGARGAGASARRHRPRVGPARDARARRSSLPHLLRAPGARGGLPRAARRRHGRAALPRQRGRLPQRLPRLLRRLPPAPEPRPHAAPRVRAGHAARAAVLLQRAAHARPLAPDDRGGRDARRPLHGERRAPGARRAEHAGPVGDDALPAREHLPHVAGRGPLVVGPGA